MKLFKDLIFILHNFNIINSNYIIIKKNIIQFSQYIKYIDFFRLLYIFLKTLSFVINIKDNFYFKQFLIYLLQILINTNFFISILFAYFNSLNKN